MAKKFFLEGGGGLRGQMIHLPPGSASPVMCNSFTRCLRGWQQATCLVTVENLFDLKQDWNAFGAQNIKKLTELQHLYIFSKCL